MAEVNTGEAEGDEGLLQYNRVLFSILKKRKNEKEEQNWQIYTIQFQYLI